MKEFSFHRDPEHYRTGDCLMLDGHGMLRQTAIGSLFRNTRDATAEWFFGGSPSFDGRLRLASR